jgi:hypothetical protein
LTASGSAIEVAYEVFRAADGDTSPRIPPGLVGGSQSADAADVYRQFATLNLTESTLEEALDSLVRQVPGLGWALQERLDEWRIEKVAPGATSPAAVCQVLLFSGDSWGETGWYLTPSGPRGRKP